jgi:hypothetical protein
MEKPGFGQMSTILPVLTPWRQRKAWLLAASIDDNERGLNLVDWTVKGLQ